MQSESQNIEYKESWRDEYLKWICGFANAQGGTLYIGVDDDKKVVGVKNSKKLMEDIPNMVKDRLGIIVDVNLLSSDGKDYIEVSVQQSHNPISMRGKYYYRTGSTLQELRGASLDTFILSRQGRTWDSVPQPGLSTKSLDTESINTFKKESVRSQRMKSEDVSGSRKVLLEKLHLYDGEYLKRAAALLFHPDPERFITGAFVKIGYFLNDADLAYQDEIHGSLFRQVAQTMDLLTTKYTKAYIHYEGIHRVDEQPLPMDGLREAVLNAIIHKAYGEFTPVQIRVYEDHIAIWNPGYLPNGWNIERLTGSHGSKPFNPDIANTFFRAGFIESWGRGIEKIATTCKGYGCPSPEWDYDGTGLWTILWFKKPVQDLTKPAHDVVHDKNTDNQIDTNKDVISSDKIGQVLDKLEQAMNKLEQDGLKSALASPQYKPNLLSIIKLYTADNSISVAIATLLEKVSAMSRLSFRRNYLNPLIEIGFMERTIPNKPSSPNQRYRLTDRGRQLLGESVQDVSK